VSLIYAIVTLVVLGFLAWLANLLLARIPMDATIRQVIQALIILAVVILALRIIIGLFGAALPF
jgi:small-conductance mechanosensitive channel